MTREILSHLRPLTIPVTQEYESLLSKFPTEIIEKIYDHLHPFVDPPLACTRTVPPEIWRYMLFHRRLLPWLWDLDPTTTFPHEGSDPLPDENGSLWDWEQLVRTLAQVKVFEPGNPMSKAPLKLRNRRRIWRILEKADFHDFEKWKELNGVYDRPYVPWQTFLLSKAVPLD